MVEFTSSVNGLTNLSGPVGANGVWGINVTLDELEASDKHICNVRVQWLAGASQAFGGPQFHLRPTSHSITIDVRDAPNLTATIEGPGVKQFYSTNKTNWFTSMTAQSFGVSPTALCRKPIIWYERIKWWWNIC